MKQKAKGDGGEILIGILIKDADDKITTECLL